jgi:hypothetical protein
MRYLVDRSYFLYDGYRRTDALQGQYLSLAITKYFKRIGIFLRFCMEKGQLIMQKYCEIYAIEKIEQKAHCQIAFVE